MLPLETRHSALQPRTVFASGVDLPASVAGLLGIIPHGARPPAAQGQQTPAPSSRSPADLAPPWGHAHLPSSLQGPAEPALQLQGPASEVPAGRVNTGLIPAVMTGIHTMPRTELEDEINNSQSAPISTAQMPASELPCSLLPQPGDNLALSLPSSPWPRRHPSFDSAVNRAALHRAAVKPEG